MKLFVDLRTSFAVFPNISDFPCVVNVCDKLAKTEVSPLFRYDLDLDICSLYKSST